MSLDTYANLKLEIAAWTGRQGTDVTTGGIDTYIDMAEAWFNRNLRVRQMVTVNAGLTVSAGGVVTHPTDWLEWKQIDVMSTPIWTLSAQSEAASLIRDNSNGVGPPSVYVVRGSTTQVWPAPDATYTYRGVYYASIPALTGSNTTNWLLTAYPEAYLFGALALGAGRVMDDNRAVMWRASLAEVVSEIERASTNAQFGEGVGSPVIRVAV